MVWSYGDRGLTSLLGSLIVLDGYEGGLSNGFGRGFLDGFEGGFSDGFEGGFLSRFEGGLLHGSEGGFLAGFGWV